MKKHLLVFLLLFSTIDSFSQTKDSILLILNSIQCIGIKPSTKEPISIQEFKIDSVRNQYQGQDPFYLISTKTPSIYAQSDNGDQNSYSYLRLRGLDQTRINFTLNGIPMNEMEDQGIYFSNMPGFLDNIGNISVMRGVGTSKYGTTSFAGSVNMETKSMLQKQTQLEFTVESYNTRKETFNYTSGLTKSKFAYNFGGTLFTTDGFKDHSGASGATYFGQIGYFGNSNIIKIISFYGNSTNHLAFLAPTSDQLNTNYRTNLNSNLEYDSFKQQMVSLNWVNYKFNHIKSVSIIFIFR